jgi:hypothetical protein
VPVAQSGSGKKNRRSTFSTYYLNKRTKDLLSIKSGRTQNNLFPDKVVNEELKVVLREATTQAPTMIDRLQYATAE